MQAIQIMGRDELIDLGEQGAYAAGLGLKSIEPQQRIEPNDTGSKASQ
jgi:hypothetical protein